MKLIAWILTNLFNLSADMPLEEIVFWMIILPTPEMQ